MVVFRSAKERATFRGAKSETGRSHHTIRLAADIGLLLALWAALRLAEELLKPVVTEKQAEQSHAC
jgi:hypothetical protein